MKTIIKSLYSNKKPLCFYASINPNRKRGLFIHSAKFFLRKARPIDDFKILIDKIKSEDYNQVISGEHFQNDYNTVFETQTDKPGQSLSLPENNYNPFLDLDTTVKINDIEYPQLNIYQYFNYFNKYLISLVPGYNKQVEKVVDQFIVCLCKLYIGFSIHQRINSKNLVVLNILDEISKQTNIKILKGDFFFSLGYFMVSQIGNHKIVQLYSKIAELMASVFIYIFKSFLEQFLQ